METIARTRKIGGSIVVTIPKEIVKEQGLRSNELINFSVKKRKRSGFGILKGMAKVSEKELREMRKDRNIK